jgi:hypothetical protein
MNIVNAKNVIVQFQIGIKFIFFIFNVILFFSITDVIHDVGEIRLTLLTESSQTSCACFRCGEQNQLKTITFKQ